MKLAADWKLIVKKAWSLRLTIVAAILSGLEILLPLYEEDFPRGVFAALAFVVTVGAAIARVVAQKDFE